MRTRRISEEEVKQITLRMKSARMLTGLTQEQFAKENNISSTSLKCWEMGRAVPRKEGLSNFINGVKKFGIDLRFEWIFHGSGPGPTYLKGTQVSKAKPESDYTEKQIELFKKHQLSKGLNPIITTIADDEMGPFYKKGDLVGGYYMTMNEVLSSMSLEEINGSPWLVSDEANKFSPRFLVVPEDKDNIYYCGNVVRVMKKYSMPTLGKICWHLREITP